MLRLFALPQTNDDNIISQEDAALAHCTNVVRDFLDETFPQHWTGRDVRKVWSLRSPDSTSADLYLWDFVTLNMYTEPIVTVPRTVITEAAECVTPNFLCRM